jgi:hypothetical protein
MRGRSVTGERGEGGVRGVPYPAGRGGKGQADRGAVAALVELLRQLRGNAGLSLRALGRLALYDFTRLSRAGHDSQVTRDELAARQMNGQIAHKGGKAPVQASQRWPVERTSSWHNAFSRLQRCCERRENVIDAFFDLADAIITVRSIIRRAWTAYRRDDRPARRP